MRIAVRHRILALGVMTTIAACGGGNGRSAPTSPSVTATPPPAVSTPPPVVPAAPPAPFSGRWSGRYVIERCDGTGSAQDLLCATRRGLFPPGTSLPIDLDLTQTGSAVSGVVALGQLTGVVSGAVRSNGLLTLSGVARSGTATATLTYWDTRASGNAMDGYFNLSSTYSGIPGAAEIAARLDRVLK